MADLIAQGPELSHRWRRTLPRDKAVVVGRQSIWSVPWDDRISREHVQLLWNGETLAVQARPEARNPVFVQGQETDRFQLRPGEHFVIGGTTFSLSEDHANVSLNAPQPMQEQAYSAQYLKRMRFRNADQRIENLSRLPEIISGASSDLELFTRVVNVLLSGGPSADAAAIVAIDESASDRRTQILHWDQRRLASGKFQP
ncbi:MAG TPA: FHA domain-containing protein, partial [Pirellulales bacterium]|nr:FHA domain-containing protein [Pirellulales bacterium]